MNSSSKACNACGMIHPAPWDGHCPVIRNRKIKEKKNEEKYSLMGEIFEKIENYADSCEDKQKFIKFCKKIEYLLERETNESS